MRIKIPVQFTARGAQSACSGAWRSIALFLVVLVSACTTPVEAPPPAPIFYPPLPNPPRIQFLTTFSGPRDFETASGFADFVLGKEDEDGGFIEKPYGVAIWQGKVFVVDTRGPGYAVFDLVKRKAYRVTGSGAGHMQKPINIVIDGAGNRYIADTGREQVLVFDAKDNFVRAYGTQGQFKPTDMLLIDDHLFVVDIAHHQIKVLAKQDGKLLDEIGRAGSGPDELFQPTNIALGPDGNLYVSDTGNFRIQKISPEGKFLASIGKVGSGLGQFARPKGIALDRHARLYAVDAAFENVQLFDAEGKLLMFFSGPSGVADSLNLPTDIVVDYDNVALFQKYAEPGFKLEYVILVANQFGKNKVTVFGFGKMEGMNYGVPDSAAGT